MMVSAREPAPVAGAYNILNTRLDSFLNYINATHTPEIAAQVNSAVGAWINVCI